ncbi:uncharacterized protein LOC129910374 [Episyrphus balteatus]|uniref:uncharacterized protein LOC129910374 n=1 Tax=Episyrphus balteatus TaxID=286459 RepID=UPI0024866F00|nr:uncharacterized protein LOC129910374 [Episyrphus balteatus]
MSDQHAFKAVPTRAALLLKNKPTFTATVFEEPKTQSETRREQKPETIIKRDKPLSSNNTPNKKDDLEFDIKRARHEVINFALNGVQAKNKKKMQLVQAIKLGAKAPKKPCKNYKELLGEKKRLKQIREERQKFHQLGKNQTGAASVRCSIRKNVAAAKRKNNKKAPVNHISKNYGVVNPKLGKKK